MKGSVFVLTLLLTSPALLADERNVDFDSTVDFSKFKTFTLREGQMTAKQPELRSPLVRKRIEDSIRLQLVAKGLKEVPNQGDIIATFRFGAANQQGVQSFPVGRLGRGRRVETFKFTEGTLVVDLLGRAGGQDLMWRGTYRDDESNPAKVGDKLPDDIKKLFQDYPPKKE